MSYIASWSDEHPTDNSFHQLRSRLESSKGDTFSGMMITEFLYGASDGSDIEASMDDFTRYASLKKWSTKQWTDLLKK